MDSDNAPQDEISRLAAQDGGAVGVHRAPARMWTRVVSAFAIFILAGAATYGYYYGKTHWSFLAGPTPSDTPEPSDTYTYEETPFETVSPSPSPSPSPSVTHDYRFDTKITIYNDTKIKGLSGKTRDRLKAESEFTKISTGNWDGARPPANVIRYNKVKLQDTAELLAKLLGVKAVAFGLTESSPIEVVLVTDPYPDPVSTPSPTP